MLWIDGEVLILPTASVEGARSGGPPPCREGRLATASRALPLVVLLPVSPQLVVLCALLWVREHLVGLVDLLELLLGRLVVGIHVGMVLAGQLAVGLAHLVL